jgi:hypothetical protein
LSRRRWYLSRHFAAALSAATTRSHTFRHVTEPLADLCAFITDFRASAAVLGVVHRAQEYEVCRGSASFSTRKHQAIMMRLDMVTAGLEAMTGGYAQAGLITGQAILYTNLHFG